MGSTADKISKKVFLNELKHSIDRKGFCLIVTWKEKDKYKEKDNTNIGLFLNDENPVLVQVGDLVASEYFKPVEDNFFSLDKNVFEENSDTLKAIAIKHDKLKYKGIKSRDNLKCYIVYDILSCELIEISQISDILNDVIKRKAKTEEYDVKLYFRGQKAHHNLVPSLFRKKDWVLREAERNALIINDNPKEFIDCRSTFEKLVKLKHYNQPSRLFDITSNPLVALYFACEESEKEAVLNIPVVITAYSNKNKEKQSVISDTVTMLSGLANSSMPKEFMLSLDKSEQKPLQCVDEDGNKKSLKMGKKNLEQTFKVVPMENTDSCYHTQCDFNSGIREHRGSYKYKEMSPEERYIEEIIHQCKKESGSELHWNDLCFNELNQCFIVKPPLNTERIVRQKGCFIMCGLNPLNVFSPPDSLYNFFSLYNQIENDDLRSKVEEKNRVIYYIQPENVTKILSELELVCIDKFFIFPELENDIALKKR